MKFKNCPARPPNGKALQNLEPLQILNLYVVPNDIINLLAK